MAETIERKPDINARTPDVHARIREAVFKAFQLPPLEVENVFGGADDETIRQAKAAIHPAIRTPSPIAPPVFGYHNVALTLEGLYRFLECEMVEKMTLGRDPDGSMIDVIFDEEGLFRGQPESVAIAREDGEIVTVLKGHVIIVQATPRGEWVGLTDAQRERLVLLRPGVTLATGRVIPVLLLRGGDL